MLKKKTKAHNSNQPNIPDYPHRILITGGSRSGKINALINHKPYSDKTDLYAKSLCEGKYQFLINESEGAGLKHCNDSKAFFED